MYDLKSVMNPYPIRPASRCWEILKSKRPDERIGSCVYIIQRDDNCKGCPLPDIVESVHSDGIIIFARWKLNDPNNIAFHLKEK